MSDKGFDILLNEEGVAREIGELLTLKLSNILKVPIGTIHCQFLLHDGRIVPDIGVPREAAEGLTDEQIAQVIQQVWWGRKPILEERLRDLRSCRDKEEA